MLYKWGCNSPMLVRFFRILRWLKPKHQQVPGSIIWVPMLPEISGLSITSHIYIITFDIYCEAKMWPQRTLPGATSFTVEKKDFRIHLQLLGFLWVHIGDRTCRSFKHQKSPFPCCKGVCHFWMVRDVPGLFHHIKTTKLDGLKKPFSGVAVPGCIKHTTTQKTIRIPYSWWFRNPGFASWGW